MKILVGVLIAAGLMWLNLWLYHANKNTPVPEGCENLKPDCGHCGIADCMSRVQDQVKETSKGDK